MGQISTPASIGWTVLNIDREYGPGAGAGASGNNVVMLGLNAGKNSAIANAVIIGNQTGGPLSTGITDLALSGSTIIGAQTAQDLIGGLGSSGIDTAMTILGQGTLPTATGMWATVLIGQGILAANIANAGFQSVLIGNGIAPALVGNVQNSVFIGYNVLNSQVNFGNQGVLIGWKALAACTASVTASVFIGTNVGAIVGTGGVNSPAQEVCIGDLADMPGGPASSVAVGYNSQCRAVSASATGNVLMGSGTQTSGSDTVGLNVIIGYQAKAPSTGTGGKNIMIGPQAGATVPTLGTHLFCIESNIGTQQAILYGDLSTGNLVIGNSTDAASRDLISGGTATNNLRLLNGTIAAGNPASGGMLYCTAGVIHYLDQNGINSQLSQSVAGQLAGNSLVAYSNNAAAAAGTLLNAPVAGNPTKWIPINDNGTIRNIPAW